MSATARPLGGRIVFTSAADFLRTFRLAPRLAAVTLLRGYKRIVSPLLPASCRFYPTCSGYAAEAVSRYGLIRGGWMAMWRLARCHPFCDGGYDPIP